MSNFVTPLDSTPPSTSEPATSTAPHRRRGVTQVVRPQGLHWVGDGFRVTNLFPTAADLGPAISPFLLMDYHPPFHYPATNTPRGVGAHPHRGFETVTMAFEGAVAHHDSTGSGGVIQAGDVQWMTAAGGILHKEYHDADWAARGGQFHMMQLWVNLPAAHKMDAPSYQGITADQMGHVSLPGGNVRVIAGSLDAVTGPAKTYTPVELWDAQFDTDTRFTVTLPSTHNAALFVLDGNVQVGDHRANSSELMVFDHAGDGLDVAVAAGTRVLLLAGQPIDEPVASYGPFVMNTTAEIEQAISDFNAGKFGQLD